MHSKRHSFGEIAPRLSSGSRAERGNPGGDSALISTRKFHEFADGSIAEVIRDPKRPWDSSLLVWKNGVARIAKQLEIDGTSTLPPRVRDQLDATITLATGSKSPREVNELLAGIAATISRYVELEDSALLLASYFVLYTWLADYLPSATYLWVVGPLGSGKTILLRVLHCLCRRAVLGDFSLASLYRLADEFEPTFILDESDFGKADTTLQRFLRVSSSQGAVVFRNGRAYQAFGAKILASRQPPADGALRSRAIIIPMLTTSRIVRPFTSEESERVKSQWQNELLGFRLENYRRLNLPVLPQARDFTPRMRAIASNLAFPVQADSDLVGVLCNILAEEDALAKSDRATEPEWLTVEALFDFCHERPAYRLRGLNASTVLVGEIANQINKNLERWGAGVTYSAKAIGGVLRSIGVLPQKFGSWGYGLKLTTAFQRKVHRLARQFGITRRDITAYSAVESGNAGQACALCSEFKLMDGLKGTHPAELNFCVDPNRTPLSDSRGTLFSKPDREEVTGTESAGVDVHTRTNNEEVSALDHAAYPQIPPGSQDAEAGSRKTETTPQEDSEFCRKFVETALKRLAAMKRGNTGVHAPGGKNRERPTDVRGKKPKKSG